MNASKNRIAEIMEARDVTRYALAKRAGYSYDGLTAVINEGKSIDALHHGTVVNLAAALGVDVDELRADCDRRELPAAL